MLRARVSLSPRTIRSTVNLNNYLFTNNNGAGPAYANMCVKVRPCGRLACRPDVVFGMPRVSFMSPYGLAVCECRSQTAREPPSYLLETTSACGLGAPSPPSCCAPPLSRWTAAPSPPSPCRKNWLLCFPLLPAITPLCLHMQVSQLHHWCVRRLQPSHVDVAQGCVCVCGCVRESVGVCGCLICGGGVWVGSSCGCAFGSMTA